MGRGGGVKDEREELERANGKVKGRRRRVEEEPTRWWSFDGSDNGLPILWW